MAYYWEKPPSNIYYISGVWVDYSGIVTHYAVHEFLNPGISSCRPTAKADLVELIEKDEVKVYVWGWDYKSGRFQRGKQVFCKLGRNGKYLHHIPYEDHSKNMKHLIRIDTFEVIVTK